MNVRLLTISLALAGLACISMEGPKNGAASISGLGLPSPSVVKGDTMRDSLGNAAPLRLTAYDGTGKALTGLTPTYFLIDTGNTNRGDSTSAGRIDSLGFLRAFSTATGAFKVVAVLGGLQTSQTTIPITVAPAVIGATLTTDTLCTLFSNESDSTRTLSPPLSITFRGADSTPAIGFVAVYSLRYSPPSVDTVSSAYVSDNNGQPMVRDTSNSSGQTGRRVGLRFQKLANDSVRTGLKQDSVTLDVSARYRGTALPGSPIHFVVPIRVRVTGTC